MESGYEATLKISGMHCSGCVDKVKQALMDIQGVHNVTVDLDENEATVTYEEDKAAIGDFEKAVIAAGYELEGVKGQE